MNFNKESKTLILSHFLLDPFKNDSALSSQLASYFLPKVGIVTQVEHPFFESGVTNSFFVYYKNGKKKREIGKKISKAFLPLTYLLQTIYSVYFSFKLSRKYDVVVACENLSFLAALVLKVIGVVKTVVYYSIDYSESRFSNRFLNNIYHLVDKVACKYSDEIWVVAKEQEAARRKNGVKVPGSKYRVVPIAFTSKDISVLPVNRIGHWDVAFCGTLRESAGIRLIIESMPILLKKHPKMKFHIVGGGELLLEMEALAKKLDLGKSVVFYGRLEKHSDVVGVLRKCSVGLAPYKRVPGSISLVSDPGKIKLYLACGLPVITTDIATSSELLEKKNAGLVTKYSVASFVKVLGGVLSDRKKYLELRKGAIALSKEFDPEMVFSKAFGDL